tara:strand:+ start:98 stop:1564 length:1467 start_codon:yes stop_codon:yes gene_type:complete
MTNQTVASVEYLTVEDANTFWLLYGAILVFFMQAGFAMLEVGHVQSKNTKNILIKNVLDASVGAIAWWTSGYGIALGSGNDDVKLLGYSVMGNDNYLLDMDMHSKANWLFQWAFCATAATIVSGAVAERITFTSYIILSTALTAFIYPVVVHAGWGEGFASPFKEDKLLEGCGVIDFAGSGVVHATGGISALVACYILGPRIGRFINGKVQRLEQQSVIFQTLGTLILWFGWYGFNGVSTLAIDGFSGVAAHTMVTTTIAAATGSLATTGLGYLHEGIVSPTNTNNGVLAGLVSITAGCSTCSPEGACAIGAIGAPVYYYSNKLLTRFRIDDVVGSVPVHGFCGLWGVLAASLFATPRYYSQAYSDEKADECAGFIYSGNTGPLLANLQFMAFLLVWVGGATTLIVYPLKKFGLLRISEDLELEGMDLSKHGGNDSKAIKRKKSMKDNEIIDEYIDEFQRCNKCSEIIPRCTCFPCVPCVPCKKKETA